MQYLFTPGDHKRKQEILDYLDSLTSKKMVTIETPKRSKWQNNTYWDNIDELVKFTGYTKEQMNAIIKNSITESGTLKMIDYVTTSKGKTYPVERSTADLDTKEFGLLLDYVFEIGRKAGCTMIIPGEYIQDIANEIFK